MTDNPYQPIDPGPPKRKWTIGQVIGLCLVVMAFPALGRIKRPPSSTGNLIDDLPFLGGQLFAIGSIIIVGLFLLLRNRR